MNFIHAVILQQSKKLAPKCEEVYKFQPKAEVYISTHQESHCLAMREFATKEVLNTKKHLLLCT